ncbi:MAG: sodium-translocating pyrophosphatase [Phycisphaeraceae bacterium]|nr:sodium-translocating pyrophosphatase [Phycisphaeraceae bacterium]
MILVPLMGVVGLAAAWWIFRGIMKNDGGDGVVADIAGQIHRGAMAFMWRELRVGALFTVLIGVAVWLSPLGWVTAVAFFTGAICSALAGWIGMYAATKANVRTALAARDRGPGAALSLAFAGGSVMGLTVASLGLLGIGGLYLAFISTVELDKAAEAAHAIEGFAMGASIVALFYRVGGGIFTKAADVGADLVGKIEAGIPEDDPRNPGVIADNVGDNVGDVAGMGSDLFESYCGSQIATVIIAATMVGALNLFSGDPTEEQARTMLMFLPLSMAAIGLVCSLVGISVVRFVSAMQPATALRVGTLTAAGLFILASLAITQIMGMKLGVWGTVLIGSFGGVLIGLITEYYTGGPPVRMIGRSARTGVATVIINGFAVGLQSVVAPVLVIVAIIVSGYVMAAEYGIGIAAVSMLATIGITMAIDAYGPVADNAGGIAEMSKMGEQTRKITDKLDSVGNTTAAIGKGFAIGAAGLAALTMTKAFINSMESEYIDFVVSMDKSLVLAGAFLGGMTAFLNGAITMRAVGGAAFDMIEEIRRQFREIPGILEGTGRPDSERCVAIAADGAMKRLIWPSMLAVGMPLAVGFILGAEALAGMLMGALISCVTLALLMANSGGAWDNAKKWVEEGNEGGKHSESHAATVVGDTVGDPFKDTSGPSMNILINVMAIWSVVISAMLTPGPMWDPRDTPRHLEPPVETSAVIDGAVDEAVESASSEASGPIGEGESRTRPVVLLNDSERPALASGLTNAPSHLFWIRWLDG